MGSKNGHGLRGNKAAEYSTVLSTERLRKPESQCPDSSDDEGLAGKIRRVWTDCKRDRCMAEGEDWFSRLSGLCDNNHSRPLSDSGFDNSHSRPARSRSDVYSLRRRRAWDRLLVDSWPATGLTEWPPPLSFTNDGGPLSLPRLHGRWKTGEEVDLKLARNSDD